MLDLKKSTFKKVPKLLSVHEKKKLLGQKLMHKVDHLVSVNRQHPLYTEFASSAAARVPQQACPHTACGAMRTDAPIFQFHHFDHVAKHCWSALLSSASRATCCLR